MRIGIDISQMCYEGTGVARYVREMTTALVTAPSSHTYVLFAGALRKRRVITEYYETLRKHTNVSLILIPIPPKLLDVLWNVLHIVPVEWFTGSIDIFWSSDWTQPPLNDAIGVTTIHDMITYRYPEEMHKTIVDVQKRRLSRVVKECTAIFCDSEATKEDVGVLLHVPAEKLTVIYPGATLGL